MHPGGQITPFANTLLIFHESSPGSVGGIMVSIAAFQAVDPGSIPGRRIIFCVKFKKWDQKVFVHAVTRIRTWVTAATTQGPNH